jgi:uncharacterized protein YegP (UPF0339 family)
MKFVVYKDVNGRWYWDLKEIAGEPVAKSAMGFVDKAHAVRNVQAVRMRAPQSLIFDPLGNLDNESGHE